MFLKKTARPAGSLVSAARSVILLFIDYVDNGVSPRCPTIRRNHFFGLIITRHFLAYCHDAGGSLLSSSPRTVISLFLSVVDDVDNARGRCTAHGEQTKAEDSDEMNRSHGRCAGPIAGGGEYEG